MPAGCRNCVYEQPWSRVIDLQSHWWGVGAASPPRAAPHATGPCHSHDTPRWLGEPRLASLKRYKAQCEACRRQQCAVH